MHLNEMHLNDEKCQITNWGEGGQKVALIEGSLRR